MFSYLRNLTSWFNYGTHDSKSNPEHDLKEASVIDASKDADIIRLPDSPVAKVASDGCGHGASTSSLQIKSSVCQPLQNFHIGMTKPAHWSNQQWREFKASQSAP